MLSSPLPSIQQSDTNWWSSIILIILTVLKEVQTLQKPMIFISHVLAYLLSYAFKSPAYHTPIWHQLVKLNNTDNIDNIKRSWNTPETHLSVKQPVKLSYAFESLANQSYTNLTPTGQAQWRRQYQMKLKQKCFVCHNSIWICFAKWCQKGTLFQDFAGEKALKYWGVERQ